MGYPLKKATGAAEKYASPFIIGRARMKTRRTTRETRDALVSGHLILRSSWGKEGTGKIVRNMRCNLYH